VFLHLLLEHGVGHYQGGHRLDNGERSGHHQGVMTPLNF
jgi:hypothetical protein